MVSKYSKKSILLQLIDGMGRSVLAATSCSGGVIVFLTRPATGIGSKLPHFRMVECVSHILKASVWSMGFMGSKFWVPFTELEKTAYAE